MYLPPAVNRLATLKSVVVLGLALNPAFLLAACEADPGYAAEDGRGRMQSDESDHWPDRLTQSEQEEVENALRSFADGESVSLPPGPAEYGMRFSDVEAAAFYAAINSEMSVIDVKEEQGGDRLRFQLVTIEDWPAELVVDRVDGPTVYEATATVGRFPDMEDRQARAADLLDAFARQMKGFGRKPRFAE